MADLRNAVIVGSNRVPFGKVGGAYASATNIDLLTAAIDGLVARFGLAGERLGEVGAGAVLKHSRDFNLTREAVLSSALSAATPAYDVQQACATSLAVAVQLSNRIRVGQIDVAIAGGVDSASDSPVAVSDRLRKTLIRLNAAKTPLDKAKTLASVRPGDLAPEVPKAAERRTGLNMGQHQALTTAQWGIARQAQDELAAASHHHLAAAWDSGFFDDLVTPYLGLTRDQPLRADTSVEKLAKLRPVFGDGPDASMTAGNSTPLSDGAATVLLADEGWARQRNLPVLARIVDAETAAVDYVLGNEGLLMAPVHATARLLARTGLSLQDFDYYEIHEAFASTVLCALAAWESADYCRGVLGLDGPLGSIDRAKLNVNGSSLAAGHPFAATGARILGTLAKMLAAKGAGSRGLISVCAAGGQGLVAIVEAC
ncbi:MAG: acetyl-CoA C-acetyltransferase [Micropruina sp.]|uniref:acetyl-CoA C-acetyltransferase n=1 Tax=Micropruina sp. TaxID=2737536 RepID=UPI0039E3CE39